MPQRRAIKLVASAALATLAITGLSVTPASAISGGTEIPNSQNLKVVKVATGYGTCTGTLIDAQWVATAASCFTQNPADYKTNADPRDPGLNARALLGTDSQRRDDPNAGTKISFIQPYTGPNDNQTDIRNFVLAKLALPALNTTPMKLATKAPTTDEKLDFIGWGRSATEWIPKTVKTGSFKISTIDTKELFVTGENNASLCLGDSGAPGIRTTNGTQEITSLNSRSWQKNCLGSQQAKDGAYATRLDDITNWIQTTIDNSKKLDGGNNQIVRINPAADKNSCLTYLARARTANDTAYSAKCDLGNQINSQRFELIEKGIGVYAIRDWYARQCVTSTNETYVIQGKCDNNSSAQKWDFVPAGNGNRYIKNVANGKVLDINGKGDLIQTDLNTNVASQRWAVAKESQALYNLPSIGSYVSIQTTVAGSPLSIRHKNGVGQVASITNSSPEADRKSSTWKIVPGLYEPECISFQSLDFPQQYLSARDINVVTRGSEPSTGGLSPAEGSFCPRTGSLADSIGFDWSGNQGYALQNVSGALKIGFRQSDNGDFERDTSWKISAPWASPAP